MSTGPAETTVLVVDDEEAVADAYAFRIQHEHGATTETAYGGREALEAIHDDVDVVLLDRRMPELSGDEVLAELRERGYDGAVIMVTAVVDPGFDVVELAFDDYLCKPVDSEDLFAAIDGAVAADAHGERVQEYFGIASKLAVLEADHSPEELAGSAEYERLEDRAAELAATLSEEVDEFEALTERFDAVDRTTT